MLSVASVKSASGAAQYFAKDDYYTAEHSSEATAWGGVGAAGAWPSAEGRSPPPQAASNSRGRTVHARRMAQR